MTAKNYLLIAFIVVSVSCKKSDDIQSSKTLESKSSEENANNTLDAINAIRLSKKIIGVGQFVII